jgi:hypothetical protein
MAMGMHCNYASLTCYRDHRTNEHHRAKEHELAASFDVVPRKLLYNIGRHHSPSRS